MPNIFHQTIEDILRAASPEQRILWNDIFLRYGERAAVSQFYYSGTIAASELVTYVSRKLYLAYQINFSSNTGVGQVANAAPVLYDAANVADFSPCSRSPYWDATAAAPKYVRDAIIINNVVFSRIDGGNMTYVKFIGYRIIY